MKELKEMTEEELYEEYRYLIEKLCSLYKYKNYYDDLKQECLIKLFECREKFNEDKGTKFSTYLYQALSMQVIRSMNIFDNLIKLPEYKKGQDKYVISPTRVKDNDGEIVDIYDTFEFDDLNLEWKINLLQAKEILCKDWYETLKLRLQGYTKKEIGYIKGVTWYEISEELRKTKILLKNKWVNLK